MTSRPESLDNPLFETRPSAIEGLGLFAVRPIAAGEVVERWAGERVSLTRLTEIESAGLHYSAAAFEEDVHLLMAVIDPRESGSDLPVGSGVGGPNHSCDSNLWMRDEITVEARRNIPAGEELTLDYALCSVDPGWQMVCNCGAALCRGVVTGGDWRLPDLQDRYAGHFSPFLNRRIAAARGRMGSA